MSYIFEPMGEVHRKEVIDIFNDYAESSFAAYPETRLTYEAYNMFLQMTKGYPAFVIKKNTLNKFVGFCFLHAYNPFSAFKTTAEISYFIAKEETGQGLGKLALSKLEEEGKAIGFKVILANISSLNNQSLKFHQKNGFKECGRLEQIGRKFNQSFDVVWMQKELI